MKRIIALISALVLIILSWYQVSVVPRRGLVVRSLRRDGIPMLYAAPAGAVKAPGVLIAHGFAGSKQLMLGYAYTFAHAGYATLLWDFGGHAANGLPLKQDTLQTDVNLARAALLEQPEVDASRIAILGHSMGSGAAMAAGIRDPQGYAAVVAVSPTGANVTPAAPRNLFLQAGSWEGRFVGNAERLLATAGGASDDLSGGRGRRLTVIPNAEHITILFRLESHRAALAWLDQTFGRATPTVYADRRILWYLLHLVGWLLAVMAAAPWLKVGGRVAVTQGRGWFPWAGLVIGPLVAGGVLFAANRGAAVGRLGGLQVGGAVALWLLAAGLIWLLFIRRAGKPAARDLAFGLTLFAFLWVAFGAMAQTVWVQWLLIPSRLALWPLLAAGCLPWFLAAGVIQQRATAGRRALWWLAQSVALVAGLMLALTLVPSLGFLVLLMPLLPVILGVLAVAGAAFDRAWAYGLGSALFFGWILAAVFPLAG